MILLIRTHADKLFYYRSTLLTPSPRRHTVRSSMVRLLEHSVGLRWRGCHFFNRCKDPAFFFFVFLIQRTLSASSGAGNDVESRLSRAASCPREETRTLSVGPLLRKPDNAVPPHVKPSRPYQPHARRPYLAEVIVWERKIVRVRQPAQVLRYRPVELVVSQVE